MKGTHMKLKTLNLFAFILFLIVLLATAFNMLKTIMGQKTMLTALPLYIHIIADLATGGLVLLILLILYLFLRNRILK